MNCNKIITIYICPECDKEYREKKMAQRCLDGHPPDIPMDFYHRKIKKWK